MIWGMWHVGLTEGENPLAWGKSGGDHGCCRSCRRGGLRVRVGRWRGTKGNGGRAERSTRARIFEQLFTDDCCLETGF